MAKLQITKMLAYHYTIWVWKSVNIYIEYYSLSIYPSWSIHNTFTEEMWILHPIELSSERCTFSMTGHGKEHDECLQCNDIRPFNVLHWGHSVAFSVQLCIYFLSVMICSSDSRSLLSSSLSIYILVLTLFANVIYRWLYRVLVTPQQLCFVRRLARLSFSLRFQAGRSVSRL